MISLRLLTAVAFLGALPVVFPARGAGPATELSTRPVKPAVEMFDLEQVRLLDGPFKDAQKLDADYLLSLDVDRLLHNFRANAGLPSTAMSLAGWESPTCELRGHFVGHYLSAVSLMYAATGDERFKQRADELVAGLAKCQDALGGDDKGGGGYLSAFPATYFDRLEAGKNVWAPYYTVHKIMAGLLDAYQHCHNEQALVVLNGMAGYFERRVAKLSDEQMQAVMKTEFGGMMEVTANLYAVNHDPAALALAERFDHRAVFDPLAAGEDRLAGLHANTQIPKMTGSARVYEMSGEPRYRDVAQFFWQSVTAHHSFVTGSNSFNEHFKAPDVEASQLVPTTAETCNTYNMLKLTRHLFAWDPQAAYADYYEKALYNHILASIDPDSGMTTYFLSLKPGHFKVYSTPTSSFWCCTGTGAENHARYGEMIYAHDDHNLWVNLFVPSTLSWPAANLSLTQQTRFPEEGKTTLTLHAAAPTHLVLRLRVPGWAEGASVKVNNEPRELNAAPGSYAAIEREWRDGDTVELTLPMTPHLYRAADDPTSVAVLDGPVVLAGELGRAAMPVCDQAVEQNAYNAVKDPTTLPALPAAAADDVGASLRRVEGKPLAFTLPAADGGKPVELVPLYQLHHQRYTVYWKVAPGEAKP